MSERIEFIYNGRHFAITYNGGHRHLEEFITPKGRTSYWRYVPPYGRSRALWKEVLGNRKKKEFIRMGLPLRWVEACGQ